MKQSETNKLTFTKAAMIDEQLFSLDIKADQLRAFLEQVVSIVNGHSNTINIIQNDLLKRIPSNQVERSFSRISESISLKDMEFLKSVSTSLDKPLAENSGDSIEDATNKVINSEQIVSSGMAWLYKRTKDWETKLNRLEMDMNDKVTKDILSKKFKKTKKKLRDEMEDGDKKLQKKINDMEKNLSQMIAQLQSNINEVEKKTLWKIQDCETLLHKRINSDFVESSCKSVYDKIMKEMERMRDENFKGFQNDLSEVKYRLNQQEEGVNERLRGMRQSLKEFQDQLQSKYVSVERLEITKNGLSDRLIDIQLKIQELQKKMDAASQLEKQVPIIYDLEQKVQQMGSTLDTLNKKIEEVRIILDSLGDVDSNKGDGNPHKLCLLEAEVKRMKVDFQDHEAKLRQMESEVKRKLDHFEQRIIGQLTVLRSQGTGSSTSKDDILLIVERDIGLPNSMLRSKMIQILQQAFNTGTNQSLEQTFKTILSDIANLIKSQEALLDFEKKATRKLKQLSGNESADLQKKLDLYQLIIFSFSIRKLDKEEFKKELLLLNERDKATQDNMCSLRHNMETLDQFSQHIEGLLQVNSQETINILTGNHRIIHQRCVVCGNKSKQTKSSAERNQDIGTAKMWNGDGKHNIYDAHDVYELGIIGGGGQKLIQKGPNQIIGVPETQQFLTTTVGQKHAVSFKENPGDLSNAAQSTFYSPTKNFRPQSAATQKKG